MYQPIQLNTDALQPVMIGVTHLTPRTESMTDWSCLPCLDL